MPSALCVKVEKKLASKKCYEFSFAVYICRDSLSILLLFTRCIFVVRGIFSVCTMYPCVGSRLAFHILWNSLCVQAAGQILLEYYKLEQNAVTCHRIVTQCHCVFICVTL